LSRPADKPHSVVDGHLSGTDVTARLGATYPALLAGRAVPNACFVLLRVGFTKPHMSPCALGVSYTAISPLPLARRFVFCGTFQQLTLSGC